MNKRKRSREEKRRKQERKAEWMTIFVNGRQRSVRRPQRIDGIPADEFIARNADPIWLQTHEMWEPIPENQKDIQNAEIRIRTRKTDGETRVIWRIESLFPDIMTSTGFVGSDSRGDGKRLDAHWQIRSNGWNGKYNVRSWRGWT